MNSDSSFFEENRYIELKNVLTLREASLCTLAVINDDIQRPNEIQDVITPLTKARYGSPVTESILHHVTPIVEKATGLSLYPTYSYHRLYKPGDYLLKHTDRVSCEISATINLGYEYITDDSDYTWNIWVNGKEFITNPGDMLVYRGIELEHWRDTFDAKPGSWQAQAFLHWVDANGKYKDFIFDGRPNLGYPDSTKTLPSGWNTWYYEE